MCKQIPYNATMKHTAARNKQRMLGEIDPYEVIIKQNITNEKEIPPQEDEILPELYNWWITDFGSSDMDLQLNFTHPLLVSAYFDKDLLQIQVKEEIFFLAKSDYQYIAPDYILTAKPIPPLLSMDELKRLPVNSGRSSEWKQMVPVVGSLLALVCLGKIWTLYLMMQIVSNVDNFGRAVIPAKAKILLD